MSAPPICCCANGPGRACALPITASALVCRNRARRWGNASGGLRRGTAYDGLTTAYLCIDLAAASKGRWEGAHLFASGDQIHGIGPTPQLIGALQLVSNIEATPSTKLYDLWFEQQLFAGSFSLRLGQEGANDEFMITQYGGLFLNSSFGFPALPALDLPSGGPNYPLATPFVRAQFAPSGEVTLLGAIYNGDPAPPGAGDPQLRDRHGTAFRLNDHTLSFAELQYSPAVLASFGQPGTYKLGMWIATGPFADPLLDTQRVPLASPASNGQPLLHATDRAIYAVIDQMIWKKANSAAQGLGFFVQIMHAPDDRNLSDMFVEGGLNWKGIIPGRSHDAAGLAVTYAGIGAAAQHFSDDLVFYSGLGAALSPGRDRGRSDLSDEAAAMAQGAAGCAIRHQPRRRDPDRAEPGAIAERPGLRGSRHRRFLTGARQAGVTAGRARPEPRRRRAATAD